MFLSHVNVSPPFSLSSPLSKNKYVKSFLKKRDWEPKQSGMKACTSSHHSVRTICHPRPWGRRSVLEGIAEQPSWEGMTLSDALAVIAYLNRKSHLK